VRWRGTASSGGGAQTRERSEGEDLARGESSGSAGPFIEEEGEGKGHQERGEVGRGSIKVNNGIGYSIDGERKWERRRGRGRIRPFLVRERQRVGCGRSSQGAGSARPGLAHGQGARASHGDGARWKKMLTDGARV
jgi:hypothetical protein